MAVLKEQTVTSQKEKLLTYFEHAASSGYWESLYSKNSYNFLTRRQEIIRMISDLDYHSVVDLGCGTGDYGDYFLENCKEYLGVDNSREMIKRAQNRFPGALFRVEDVEDLSLLSEKFDLALAIGLIEYYVEPNKLIQETRRILKKGGYFLVQAPHTSVIWRIDHRVTFRLLHSLAAIRRYLRKQPFIFDTSYTELSLRALIEPYGFENCRTSYCNYRLMPFPLSVLFHRLEEGVSERIAKAKSREKFKCLASNVIVLFRKV